MHNFQEKQKYYDEKDRLILELFRTNPQSAFKLMFDTYYMPLCLYAVQLTDSFVMAEDIVQDFFISFWEKKTYLNIAVKLRSYLFYSIRNNSYLSLRKHNLVSMEELFDTEIDIIESITDEEELREKEKKIMEELEKLPKQELSAVQAVILENKKYKEAAEELNISVNTLKTHLSRALKRLRKDNNLILLWL